MLKFFGSVGLVGTVVVFYLVTYGVGPERQLPPEVSLLEGFRADGYLPENVNLEEDARAEDAGVFEVPDQDAVVLEAAIADMGDMNMGGMDMSGGGSMNGMDMSGSDNGTMAGMDMSGSDGAGMTGMDMSGNGDTAMAGMDMSGDGEAVLDMDMNGDGVMDMSSADMGNMNGMNMGADDTAMAGVDMAGNGDAVPDMDMNGDGVMDMSSADMANTNMSDGAGTTMNGMDMSGNGDTAMAGMDMSGSNGAAMSSMPMGEGGLAFSETGEFDRVIELSMQEWGYSDMNITVKKGERIKFIVKNEGQIPHEFMFMNMQLMAAANYRGTRADWSLLEHEALFEQALILPGGEFEFVLEVQQNGAWMFMCMLPYHMQMGMMGQMATEGMAMDMGM